MFVANISRLIKNLAIFAKKRNFVMFGSYVSISKYKTLFQTKTD